MHPCFCAEPRCSIVLRAIGSEVFGGLSLSSRARRALLTQSWRPCVISESEFLPSASKDALAGLLLHCRGGSSHSAGDHALTPWSSGPRTQESRVSRCFVCPDQHLEFNQCRQASRCGQECVQLCRPVALGLHSQQPSSSILVLPSREGSPRTHLPLFRIQKELEL